MSFESNFERSEAGTSQLGDVHNSPLRNPLLLTDLLGRRAQKVSPLPCR